MLSTCSCVLQARTLRIVGSPFEIAHASSLCPSHSPSLSDLWLCVSLSLKYRVRMASSTFWHPSRARAMRHNSSGRRETRANREIPSPALLFSHSLGGGVELSTPPLVRACLSSSNVRLTTHRCISHRNTSCFRQVGIRQDQNASHTLVCGLVRGRRRRRSAGHRRGLVSR
jgi:hypothetical protein